MMAIPKTNISQFSANRRGKLRRLLPALLVAVFLGAAVSAPVHGEVKLRNAMAGHGSPYLRLHENDPVAWQQWDARVMELARKNNKLVFVSIGYFSCHWCHVMQRESYSDKGIAAQLNAHFIPVKVDRELNPALDAYLIEFVRRTRGHAGWPLNVILSPEGYPIVGMTYVPRDQFSKVLKQTVQLWRQNADFIRQMARNAAAEFSAEKTLTEKPVTAQLARELADAFTQQVLQIADDMSGGFGDQSKFPMAPQLHFLLQQYERQQDESLKAFLEITLDQMATQGLRDHIGGGFFRYTVDPTWQTPHFEKMLYDNASLALLYLRAAPLLQRPDYYGVARETLNFMIRELQVGQGGLASSLSAVDSNDVEGGYYLWNTSALKALLGEQEYEVIHMLWNMEVKPQFDAGYLPRHAVAPDSVADQLGISVDDAMGIIATAQARLFNARQRRSIPLDSKQLAGWNGLALQALAEAAGIFAGKDAASAKKFKTAAQRIRDYVVHELWDGDVLLRAKAGSQSLGEALLEDYAFAAQGLWAWYRLTGDKKDRELVEQWTNIAWQRFYGNTGWQNTDRPLLPGNFGNAVIQDAPLPSASATVIALSMQLARQEKDERLERKVTQALSVGHESITDNPFNYPSQVDVMLDYVALLNDRKE